MKKLQLQKKSFKEEKEKLPEELKLAQSQMETKEQEGLSESLQQHQGQYNSLLATYDALR